MSGVGDGMTLRAAVLRLRNAWMNLLYEIAKSLGVGE